MTKEAAERHFRRPERHRSLSLFDVFYCQIEFGCLAFSQFTQFWAEVRNLVRMIFGHTLAISHPSRFNRDPPRWYSKDFVGLPKRCNASRFV
jgi:hypothetical protein